MKVVIFYGSVREGRNGIRAVTLLQNLLTKNGASVTVLDAKELNLPMLAMPIFAYKDPASIPAWLQNMAHICEEADAFIMVTGEYNHSIQPGLKNLIDHLSVKQLAHRPVAIVSYSVGAFGGVMAQTHLREVVAGSNLSMCLVPHTWTVPTIDKTLDESGNALDPAAQERAEKLMQGLLWYAEAIKNQRKKRLTI